VSFYYETHQLVVWNVARIWQNRLVILSDAHHRRWAHNRFNLPTTYIITGKLFKLYKGTMFLVGATTVSYNWNGGSGSGESKRKKRCCWLEFNSPPQTLRKPSQGAHCSPKESNSSLSLPHCEEQSEPSMPCLFSSDHPTLSWPSLR
jgi:hypothetical protein